MISATTQTLYLCSELVQVETIASGRLGTTLSANLQEICEEGALLHADAAVPRGTKVRIRCQDYGLEAVVEDCSYEDWGYAIWVLFAPQSRWSMAKFVPSHLLDPRALVKGSGHWRH